MSFKPMVVKRCEYSNYFSLTQTSFQTGVDKCETEYALTFCWLLVWQLILRRCSCMRSFWHS